MLLHSGHCALRPMASRVTCSFLPHEEQLNSIVALAPVGEGLCPEELLMPRSDGLCRVAETPTNCARPASPRLPPRINRDAREILHAKAFADRMPDTSERDGRERVPKITLPHRFKWPRGETYFLRCRILERMRRFLRPNFRRPFPDFFVPTQSSWGFCEPKRPAQSNFFQAFFKPQPVNGNNLRGSPASRGKAG